VKTLSATEMETGRVDQHRFPIRLPVGSGRHYSTGGSVWKKS